MLIVHSNMFSYCYILSATKTFISNVTINLYLHSTSWCFICWRQKAIIWQSCQETLIPIFFFSCLTFIRVDDSEKREKLRNGIFFQNIHLNNGRKNQLVALVTALFLLVFPSNLPHYNIISFVRAHTWHPQKFHSVKLITFSMDESIVKPLFLNGWCWLQPWWVDFQCL